MRVSLTALRRRIAAILALGALGVASCDTPPTPPPDPSTARLVVCPTTQTLSTQLLVGTGGGLVSLAGTVVGIPSGALSLPTLITLTIPASQFMEVDIKANSLTEPFLFNREIAVQIDYSRCTDPALATRPVTVWYIDSQTKKPLEHMGGVDDKAKRTVTFKTNHLSAYAIAF
jgi:hypothetical protein